MVSFSTLAFDVALINILVDLIFTHIFLKCIVYNRVIFCLLGLLFLWARAALNEFNDSDVKGDITSVVNSSGKLRLRLLGPSFRFLKYCNSPIRFVDS